MLTASEVAKHSTRESAWVVIRDQAYDVTDFLPEHPGGAAIILKYAGRDATEAFEPIHPPDALDSLPPDKRLGKVDPSTIAPPPDQDVREKPKRTGSKLPPLGTVVNTDDIEAAAERVLKPKAWAYYKSAADDELAAAKNRSSWDEIGLRPRVLVDCRTADQSTVVLGHRVATPVFIAPAALAKLAHPEGEKALCKAAGAAGAIYVMSANSSCSVEEVAAVARPGQVLFFQLYVNRSRAKSEALLARVERLGFKAIVLTVDAPVGGKRTRDEKAKAIELAEDEFGVSGGEDSGSNKAGLSVAQATGSYIDPSLSWDDLAWVRSRTSLPLVLKGVQTAEDAALCALHGADAVYLSNHGGRQVEGAPSAAETLLEVRRHCPWVLDRCEVYVDGGVRKGASVLKAVALGARAVGVGRLPMYSLVWGQQGVERMFAVLAEEIATTMRLLGVPSLDRLGLRHLNTKRLDNVITDDFEDPRRVKSKL